MNEDKWQEFEELVKVVDFRYQMLGCPSKKDRGVLAKDQRRREGMKQRRLEIRRITKIRKLKKELEKIDRIRVYSILKKYHPYLFNREEFDNGKA